MLQPTAFANAATSMSIIVYVACRLLTIVIPNAMFNLLQNWVHTINLASLKMTDSLSFGTFIWGLVSIAVLTWLIAYATIVLYNRLAR